jgi:hypothetical protein
VEFATPNFRVMVVVVVAAAARRGVVKPNKGFKL